VSVTARHELPIIAEGQSGRIPYNNGANLVDAKLQGNLKSRTTSAQPGSPADGDCYLVPVAASGARWTGEDGKLAFYYNGWLEDEAGDFYAPVTGMLWYVEDEDTFIYYDGASWFELPLPANAIIASTITIPNSGLHLLDTNATHDLIISPGSNLTADRTLSIVTGDSNRTITLSGDVTLSGTHSGTNTGDVTLSGTPNYITLAAQVLTLTKLDLVDDLNTFSSANLATMVTDETGTGALVFADSPTLVTPSLGTPSAVNLANATNLPIAALSKPVIVAGPTTSDQTAIGTSFADVTGLGISVVNGGEYLFEFYVIADADAATTGIDLSINGPTTSYLQYTVSFWSNATTMANRMFNSYDAAIPVTGSNGTDRAIFKIYGVAKFTASGTLIPRIKREAVGSGPNVRTGSVGYAVRTA